VFWLLGESQWASLASLRVFDLVKCFRRFEAWFPIFFIQHVLIGRSIVVLPVLICSRALETAGKLLEIGVRIITDTHVVEFPVMIL